MTKLYLDVLRRAATDRATARTGRDSHGDCATLDDGVPGRRN